MSTISSISLSRLDQFCHNSEVLRKLQPNEQLWTFGNHMVKSIAPDSICKHSKCPLLKAVNKIVEAALKLIFALGRFVTGQDSERNLKKVENLAVQLENEFNKFAPNPSDNNCYLALEKLNAVKKNLKGAIHSGLKNFKETCQTGAAELIIPPSGKRNAHAEKVQAVIDNLDAETVYGLTHKIKEVEKALSSADQAKLEQIFDLMISKKEMDIDLANIRVTSEAFKNAAKIKYGKEPVTRALEYYGLREKKTLTGTDVAALLVGIATNLTFSDLLSIYYSQQNEIVFEHCSDEELCAFLGKIRDIKYDAIAPNPKMRYFKQLAHDQNLLHIMGDYEEFNPLNEPDKILTKSLRKYSHAELLARHLAYALYDDYGTRFPDGILFPMYDKKNNLCLKEAKNIVSGNGLYAAVVRPAVIRDEKKVPVHVLFRGTYCMDSWMRDFSPKETVTKAFFEGPGRASFEKKRDKIVEKIFSEIEKAAPIGTDSKILLEFIGHSLGGSDSQRALEYFAGKLAEEKNHAVKGMSLYAFNSPNLEPDIAKRFITSVDKLKIPFKLRYFDVHHDSVQEFGSKRLGYCGKKVKRPENLHISIFKFDRNVAERIAALAKHVLAKGRYFFQKALEVHTFYSLKLHENESSTKYNTTFIKNIYTDNDRDAGLHYGADLKQVSEKIKTEEMDDHLVTNAGRIGRKIKRASYKVLNAVSFGRWNYVYEAPDLKWKKDPA